MLRRVAALHLAFALAACNHDPGPMKVPTSQDVPVPPATALSAGPPPAAPGSAPPASSKRPPCTNDQSCNEDEAVSALWGKCMPLGTCECVAGFQLNPRGRCQKIVE